MRILLALFSVFGAVTILYYATHRYKRARLENELWAAWMDEFKKAEQEDIVAAFLLKHTVNKVKQEQARFGDLANNIDVQLDYKIFIDGEQILPYNAGHTRVEVVF